MYCYKFELVNPEGIERRFCFSHKSKYSSDEFGNICTGTIYHIFEKKLVDKDSYIPLSYVNGFVERMAGFGFKELYREFECQYSFDPYLNAEEWFEKVREKVKKHNDLI